MRFAFLFALLGAAGIEAQSDTPKSTTFEERPGLVLANDRLELTVLTQGATLGNLVLRDDPERLSPLWNPIRMAREAGRRASGAGMGHFVCVDGFGPVSAEEQAAGLPGHGEAHRQTCETRHAGREGKTVTLTLASELPIARELFTRTFRLVDGENVVYVESEIESLLGFDRPLCWAEHATIGAPFLEPGKTVVDMSARRGKTRSHEAKPGPLPHRLASFRDFTWPVAPTVDGGTVDLRAAPPNPNSLDHTACLMDPDRKLVFVTALHTGKRLLLGYLFKREEYPWLQTWEDYPADLKMARGLEFGTQPFVVPRRGAIQTGSLFDTLTYRWLPAKSKIRTSFVLFFTRAPEGFARVDDVRLERNRILIEDRAAGRRIALEASLPW